MRKNAALECIRPVSYDSTAGKDEILILVETVIKTMNKGFANMDTKLQMMEEQLNVLRGLLEQMHIYKR